MYPVSHSNSSHKRTDTFTNIDAHTPLSPIPKSDLDSAHKHRGAQSEI